MEHLLYQGCKEFLLQELNLLIELSKLYGGVLLAAGGG